MPSGNKPLPEKMLAEFHMAILRDLAAMNSWTIETNSRL